MHYLRWSLAAAGVIPFAVGTFCLLLDINTLPLLGSTEITLSLYGLVIAAFMAGSQWGVHLSQTNASNLLLPLSSNIAAIFLWLSYAMLGHPKILAALAICFVWILFVDYLIYRNGVLSLAYIRLRFTITACVVLLLIISAIFSL